MSFEYFYGGQADSFSFYRIPRQLVTGAEFRHLSTEAKLLYGMMLDRMGLSARNGWFDDFDRVYIYYTIDEIMEDLCCGHNKAVRLLAELDTKGVGLIERKKQGQGKPTMIYVRQFVETAPPAPRGESAPSRLPKTGSQEDSKEEDEISRENDLSVIEPIGKGKPYAEWNAEKNGKPTVRGLIRQDVDAALDSAFTLQSFYEALQKQGYVVKRGANVKHTAVKPPGSDRFVRLDSLGDGYTEADIRERLNKSRTQPTAPEPQAAASLNIPKGRYKVKRRSPAYGKKQKLSGLRRLYLHYLYLLSPPRPRRRPIPFPVRAEVRKLDQYKRQFALLQKYRINSESQLSMLADALQADIDSLVFSRRELYRRQRRGEDVSAEIKKNSLALRPIRRELKCCQQVADRIPQIQEHIRLTRQAEEQNTSEKTKPKERRHDLWK